MDTNMADESHESTLRHNLVGRLCAALIAHSPPPATDKERVAWRQELVAEASQITDMVLVDDSSAIPQSLMLAASVADCLRPAVKGRPDLSWTLGEDAHGRPLRDSWDTESPHLLIAGNAGSGKSTVMDVALCQMLHGNHPDDLAVWLVGSNKRLSAYKDAPHVERSLNTASPPSNLGVVADFLTDAVAEMDARREAMASHPSKPPTFADAAALATTSSDDTSLPSTRLVIAIDECSNYFHRPFRDDERGIKTWNGIVGNVERIARNSRATGIHMMISTQYPTGANVPAALGVQCRRIGLRTSSVLASRIILGQPGLEHVEDPGSGLYDQREGSGPVPFRGLYLSPTGRDAIIARLPRRPDGLEMASAAA